MEIAANNIQNINNAKINKPLSQANQTRINNLPNDEFCFSEMYVDLKYDESSRDRSIYKGKINGFDTVLRSTYGTDSLAYYYEGKIGNSKINLESDENNNISGEINGKKFNINFESDVEKMFKKTIFGEKLNKPPKYVSFIGEFDNKPFEIKIPGANIPNDTDAKNLIALALNFNGLSPEIYQNKIVSVNWKDRIWEENDKLRDKQDQNKKENLDSMVKPLLMIILTSLLTNIMGKLGKSK